MLGNAAILQPTRRHTCNHGLVLTRLVAAIVPGAHGAHWLHSCRSAAVLTAVNQPGGLLHLLHSASNNTAHISHRQTKCRTQFVH
jgi:hypothetical protein